MKNVLLKSIAYKLLPLLVFLPVICYFIYSATESVSVTATVGILSLAIWYFIFMHTEGKRRNRYVEELISKGFPNSEEDPILPLPDGNYSTGWEKGFGFTNEIGQPMFVKVGEAGISLLYFCVANKKPILIYWDRITSIIVFERSIEGKQSLLARLYIFGISMIIIIPWNSVFNDIASQYVTLDNENSDNVN